MITLKLNVESHGGFGPAYRVFCQWKYALPALGQHRIDIRQIRGHLAITLPNGLETGYDDLGHPLLKIPVAQAGSLSFGEGWVAGLGNREEIGDTGTHVVRIYGGERVGCGPRDFFLDRFRFV